MLTFEKVLGVFADYLAQEKEHEALLTNRGYIVIHWEDDKGFVGRYCKTPEVLRDALIDCYQNRLEFDATRGRRELEEEDMIGIHQKVEIMRMKCQE